MLHNRPNAKPDIVTQNKCFLFTAGTQNENETEQKNKKISKIIPCNCAAVVKLLNHDKL